MVRIEKYNSLIIHELVHENYLYSIKVDDHFFEYKYSNWLMRLTQYLNIQRYITLPTNIIYNYQIQKLIIGYKLSIYIRKLDYSAKPTHLKFRKIGSIFIYSNKIKNRLEWRLQCALKKNDMPRYSFIQKPENEEITGLFALNNSDRKIKMQRAIEATLLSST